MPKLIGVLGAVTPGSPAGEISGVALLATDLQRLAAELRSRMGTIAPNRAQYLAVKAKLAVLREGDRLSGPEIAQFVGGTVGACADAIATARQIARQTVNTVQEQADNHARQASLIDPARLMWQTAGDFLVNMQPAGAAFGLGIAPVVVAALIVAGGIVLAAGIAAATYYVDAGRRLEQAQVQARALCREFSPPCSPQQAAAIIAQLSISPLDRFAEAAGTQVAKDFTGLAIGAGVAGGVLLLGVGWWYLGGRSWLYRKVTR